MSPRNTTNGTLPHYATPFLPVPWNGLHGRKKNLLCLERHKYICFFLGGGEFPLLVQINWVHFVRNYGPQGVRFVTIPIKLGMQEIGEESKEFEVDYGDRFQSMSIDYYIDLFQSLKDNGWTTVSYEDIDGWTAYRTLYAVVPRP